MIYTNIYEAYVQPSFTKRELYITLHLHAECSQCYTSILQRIKPDITQNIILGCRQCNYTEKLGRTGDIVYELFERESCYTFDEMTRWKEILTKSDFPFDTYERLGGA